MTMNTPIPFPHERARALPPVASGTPPPSLPGLKHKALPRLFEISYISQYRQLRESITLWGTLYPNGYISLENGVVFESMCELQDHFKRASQVQIRWIALMQVEEGE